MNYKVASLASLIKIGYHESLIIPRDPNEPISLIMKKCELKH